MCCACDDATDSCTELPARVDFAAAPLAGWSHSSKTFKNLQQQEVLLKWKLQPILFIISTIINEKILTKDVENRLAVVLMSHVLSRDHVHCCTGRRETVTVTLGCDAEPRVHVTYPIAMSQPGSGAGWGVTCCTCTESNAACSADSACSPQTRLCVNYLIYFTILPPLTRQIITCVFSFNKIKNCLIKYLLSLCPCKCKLM